MTRPTERSHRLADVAILACGVVALAAVSCTEAQTVETPAGVIFTALSPTLTYGTDDALGKIMWLRDPRALLMGVERFKATGCAAGAGEVRGQTGPAQPWERGGERVLDAVATELCRRHPALLGIRENQT